MKKLFICLWCGIVSFAYTQEWTNFPSGITLNAGESRTIELVGDNSKRGNYFYNTMIFNYSTLGSTTSELTLTPKTPLNFFYNTGQIRVQANSKLSLLLNTQFNLDRGSSYSVDTNAELIIEGIAWYATGGSFVNQGQATLSFDSFNNNSKADGFINQGGNVTITVKNGDFNNGKFDDESYGIFIVKNGGSTIVDITSPNHYFNNFGYVYDLASDKTPIDFNTSRKSSVIEVLGNSTLHIKGADVFNGGTAYSPDLDVTYKNGSGYITADDSKIIIDKRLVSQGAGVDLAPGSDYAIIRSQIKALNNSQINIGENFENRGYSDIYVFGSQINVNGDFKNDLNTNIFFNGSASNYGKITASTIDVEKSNLTFYKGSTNLNTPYIFLEALSTGANSLKYNASILNGLQDVLANDGSKNVFYQAKIKQVGNQLQVTFQEKANTTKPDKPSTSETSGGDTTPPTTKPDKPSTSEIGGGDISEVITQYTPLNQNEQNILNAFDTQEPIPNFDIKNMGINQIKNMTENINDTIAEFVNHKNAFNKLSFDTNKLIIFDQMNKASLLHISKTNKAKYAANTINSTQESQIIDYEALQDAIYVQKNLNNLYINILGAYQKSANGMGYEYDFNTGYNRYINNNLFLGLYLSYIGGNSSFDTTTIKTNAFQTGIYSRINLSIIETDVILSYNYANNQAQKNLKIFSNTYSNQANYNTHSLNLFFSIGPKFALKSNLFLKPYIALNLNSDFNTPISETSTQAQTQAFNAKYLFENSSFLGGILGIEYRQYFKKGYFFLRPSIEYTLYSNLKDTQVLFLNTTITVPALPKENFASIILGGEIPINDRFFINLNTSAKFSNLKTLLVAGSASLKFVF